MTGASKPPIGPAELAAQLIRCESVTPDQGGALDLLEQVLGKAGFEIHRLTFSDAGTPDVENLYARTGRGRPHLCFAGHVDVVPPGDDGAWRHPPFGGEVEDQILYGRGAVDMKGAVACFTAAVLDFLIARGDNFDGTISLLITCDEEGPAVNGTKKLLEWVKAHDRVPDHCLLGEPTNPDTLGEAIKVGRRGSLNGTLTVTGTQGHVAYPELADNPLPRLIAMARALLDERFDQGSEHFQPTNLEISSIDVGNEAENIIPARGTARFNVRFNDHHTSNSVKELVTSLCQEVVDHMGGEFELDFHVSGEWFLAAQDSFAGVVADAIFDVTARKPAFSTSGGTSDGRFIKDYCPVIEFGLVGQTMHKVDEHVPVKDLETLTRIYTRVLEHYFAA